MIDAAPSILPYQTFFLVEATPNAIVNVNPIFSDFHEIVH